jgi:dethiobiotin synthetase
LGKTIYFTGTNTGVGKTVAAAATLRLARRHAVRCAGLKPIATGGTRAAPGGPLRNGDALELQAAGSLALDYDTVNPFCFEPALAPHLAARDAGTSLDLPRLVTWLQGAAPDAQLRVVEGVGGWRVPLHPTGFTSDLPEALALDVILVVGLTLGCLNHARLTLEAIERGGRCQLAGWIANAVDPTFERSEDNVSSLTDLLGVPPAARIPHLDATPRSPFGNPTHEFADDAASLLAAMGVLAPQRRLV